MSEGVRLARDIFLWLCWLASFLKLVRLRRKLEQLGEGFIEV